jgi:hypothetical protein
MRSPRPSQPPVALCSVCRKLLVPIYAIGDILTYFSVSVKDFCPKLLQKTKKFNIIIEKNATKERKNYGNQTDSFSL